jgi:hypothetical protein
VVIPLALLIVWRYIFSYGGDGLEVEDGDHGGLATDGVFVSVGCDYHGSDSPYLQFIFPIETHKHGAFFEELSDGHISWPHGLGRRSHVHFRTSCAFCVHRVFFGPPNLGS